MGKICDFRQKCRLSRGIGSDLFAVANFLVFKMPLDMDMHCRPTLKAAGIWLPNSRQSSDVQQTELDQLLLKCISITKYKLHFLKVIQILFSITLAMTGKIQNTFLESN